MMLNSTKVECLEGLEGWRHRLQNCYDIDGHNVENLHIFNFCFITFFLELFEGLSYYSDFKRQVKRIVTNFRTNLASGPYFIYASSL